VKATRERGGRKQAEREEGEKGGGEEGKEDGKEGEVEVGHRPVSSYLVREREKSRGKD
jgi:hypothetical protein